MPLEFVLPFFSVSRPIDIQPRQRLPFNFSSCHWITSNHMIGSGFPRWFLEHSPFDHFCAPCRCFFTNSHILRCFFSRLSVVFLRCEPLLPAPSSTSFCFAPKFSFCLSSFLLITAFWNSICVLSLLLSSFLSQRSGASPHSLGSQREPPRSSSINIVKDAMQARLQSGLWTKAKPFRSGVSLT